MNLTLSVFKLVIDALRAEAGKFLEGSPEEETLTDAADALADAGDLIAYD